MLENRECYHGKFYHGEVEDTGWNVVMMIDGVNRGCSGFDSKKDAEKWLEDNKDYKESCFGMKAKSIEIKKLT